MKKVVVLGSTGSLGTQTLEVLEKYPEYFKVIGLSAGTNEKLLHKQAKNLTKNVSLGDLPELGDADIVVNVISGLAGIKATLKTLEHGKTLLLGNKESLVAEGEKVKTLLEKSTGAQIIPLDSEHNAIYEILKTHPGKVKRLILPCSGGPFLKRTNLENITVEEAINHPKWKMGPKISLESATLINKGLEVLEAHYLFDIPIEKIEVKIHPECEIHGAVELEISGQKETIAYFARPDMKEHIENTLLRAAQIEPPKREIRPLRPEEFALSDPPPHLPGIQTVLNARNHKEFLKKEEETLSKFLNNEITFPEIFKALN